MTHLALAWSLQRTTTTLTRNDAAHTIVCAVSSLISSPASSSAPSTDDDDDHSPHPCLVPPHTMMPTRNNAAHAIACAASSLVLSSSSAHPHRPYLTSIPTGIPPRVSVQVPCGFPAHLPAPTTTGAGKRWVRVRVSLRTPGGIPVLLPSGSAFKVSNRCEVAAYDVFMDPLQVFFSFG